MPWQVILVFPRISVFDASHSFVSELGQDRQSLLFGENTLQVHTLPLAACEETTVLCLTLRVKAAYERRLHG